MNDYRVLVERLADERSTESVGNSTVEHARVLVSNLFRTAEREVVLVCGYEDAAIYGDGEVFPEMHSFLARGGKLAFTLDTTSEAASGEAKAWEIIFAALKISAKSAQAAASKTEPEDRDNKEIVASPLTMAKVAAKQLPFHMLVADDRAYRFEPKKEKVEAIACFNDRSFAVRLKELSQAMVH